jgi:hypothetical protein
VLVSTAFLSSFVAWDCGIICVGKWCVLSVALDGLSDPDTYS